MKKFFIFLCIINIFCVRLYPQVFKPFRKLYTIQTKKFEIIFPIESRRTAENLAKTADNIYEKYSKILNSTVRGKIAITITPDFNLFNSAAMILPYSSLILYDTNLDENFTSYSNNFESVFIHELTHLLSMTSENTGLSTKILGNWASFVHINAMPFMIEGAPVSMESFTGFGRANDPLVKQRLRQDMFEGNFRTPIQVSYVWTKMPYGNVYYEYGGLFSKYLQERFGMEKYNEFWNRMHTKLHFSFLVYNSGVYGAFKKVYGIKFNEVWYDFQSSLALENINPSENMKVNDKETFINDIYSYDDTVYYIDGDIGALYSYKKERNNQDNKKDLKLEFLIDRGSESLDISKDGKNALIVSVMYSGGLYKYIIKEYDLNKKIRTKRKWFDLQYARYFKEGIIGVSKDLHNSILVYINENNEKEILLPANDNFGYSSPAVIDDNNIALIITENGIKHLAVFNYNNKSIKYIDTKDNTLNYVRYLRHSNNKLLFSYNNDDRYYKLGEIDLNNNSMKLYTKDYSGGVFSAVYAGEDIYYKGRFSEYDSIMRYTDKESISKKIEYTDKEINKYEFNPEMELGNYNAFKYLKPWAMWIPLPQINNTFPLIINGLGILSYISTPALNNLASIWIGYDIPSNFLQTELTVTSFNFLYPLYFGFKSDVVYSSYNYWRLNSYIAMQFILNTESDKLYFLLEPSVIGALFSEFVNPKTNTSSAFNWKYSSYTFNVSLKASMIFRVQNDKPYRDDLVNITVYPTYSIKYNKFAVDFSTKFQTRYIPIRASFYGSYAFGTNTAFDGASAVFGAREVKAPEEFYAYVQNKKYKSNYFLGGDIELLGYLSSHFNLSHIYFDNFFASLSYRYAYFSKDYMHSAALKLGFNASIPVSGHQNIVTGEPYIMFALNLPKKIDDNTLKNYPSLNDIYVGLGVQMSW
ncbi:TreP protein [uncultured Brachyspira sp.]|uniref:TreP protein n=1 Tax=uncultured Brachyspira sp. TaxID=221953 RepID=UPI0025FE4E22|nr:TreP protein [uncultured Brachyspira sp.]